MKRNLYFCWIFCVVQLLLKPVFGDGDDNDDDNDDEEWIIPVAVVCSIVGVSVCVVLIVYFCMRQNKRKKAAAEVIVLAPAANQASSSAANAPSGSEVMYPSTASTIPGGYAYNPSAMPAPPPYDANYPTNPSYNYDNVPGIHGQPHAYNPAHAVAPSAPDKKDGGY